jgi:hypothetical protein
MSFLPLITLAMSEVPPSDAGLGSAIVTLSLQMSAAVDLAILVTVAATRTATLRAAGAAARDATVAGYRLAYMVAVVAVLLGLSLSALLLRPRASARVLAAPPE